ncbi:MAG: transposase [Chitinophagales bacterium]
MPGIFFITITCYNWLNLFEIANAYQCVFNLFDALRKDGNKIVAFVIMPNHLHTLIYFTNTQKSVNQYVGTGKRFMAYTIVKLHTEQQNTQILSKLKSGVNVTKKSINKKHQVFEPSFDCKKCFSNPFTLQKLNYIHTNSIRGKWMLVERPCDYKYSSALQYETGKISSYPITLLSEINAFDFSL